MSDTTFTRDDVKVLSTDMPGDQRGHWWHIQIGDQYFIVSAIDLSFDGFVIDGYRTSETMAFRADAEGEVTGWSELAMVPCRDHEACIADLLEVLNPDAPEVPVPVAAQSLDLDEIREIHQDWETGLAACPRPDGPCIKCQLRANDAAKRIPALLAEVYQLRAELAAVDLAAASLEPAPRWGAGPLVDHNLETTGTGSAYPAKYGYCAQCGAEPGQSCHYMFGDGTANQEPNSVRPEPHFYRDSPDDDPNWRNLRAYKGSGTGSADRTKVEHRVVETETLNYLTGSERLTCSCGWSGHSTRWNDRDHGADVPRPPASAPRPPVSRDALRAALYGDRRGGAR